MDEAALGVVALPGPVASELQSLELLRVSEGLPVVPGWPLKVMLLRLTPHPRCFWREFKISWPLLVVHLKHHLSFVLMIQFPSWQSETSPPE